LIGGVADSTLGTGREKLVEAAWKDLAEAYRAHGGVPRTDDLDGALRLAQLTASCAMVLEERKRADLDAVDHRAAPRDPFLPAALDFLREQVGLVPSLTLRDNPAMVQRLDAALDGGLVSAADGPRSTWEPPLIPNPMGRNLRPPKAGGRPYGRRATWRAAKRAEARAGD
jgi:hypothetical protein